MAQDRAQQRALAKARRPQSHDAGPSAAHGWYRCQEAAEVVKRARYRGWFFGVTALGDLVQLTIIRAVGPTLACEGPWSIPSGADDEAVRAILLDAVAAIDGEEARDRVAWRK